MKSRLKLCIMKLLAQQRHSCERPEKPSLTLGELIARTYIACGDKGAPNILHLAMEAQVVNLRGHRLRVSQWALAAQ